MKRCNDLASKHPTQDTETVVLGFIVSHILFLHMLQNLQDAQQHPNSSMAGTGMTPEGIGSNYVIFDLMSEMSWRTTVENVEEW